MILKLLLVISIRIACFYVGLELGRYVAGLTKSHEQKIIEQLDYR